MSFQSIANHSPIRAFHRVSRVIKLTDLKRTPVHGRMLIETDQGVLMERKIENTLFSLIYEQLINLHFPFNGFMCSQFSSLWIE